MTVQELKRQGAIYFDNIQSGFECYSSSTVTMTKTEAIVYFEKLAGENGWHHSFTDFYYFQLQKEAREKVNECLTSDERAYLKQLEEKMKSEDIIFPLDPVLLGIVTVLNEQEMLFSTLYFTHNVRTYWGNYNQQYVIFE